MLSIKQLRELGGGLNNLTDEQIVKSSFEAFKGYYPDFNSFAKEVGYEPERDFTRGLEMGGRHTLAAGAGALAMGADAVGAEGVRDYMLDASRGQSRRAFQLSRQSDNVDNFTQDPLSYLSSGAGQVVSFAAPSLLTGGAGALMAPALGISRLAGATLGAYGANFAQESGGIYNDLAEQGRYEPGRAALYGAGAAVLDTATEMLPFARGGLRGGLPARIAKGAAIQAPLEAGTEVAQTAIERAGAYKDLASDDAWSDYRNAGALGLIGGGMFGGTTGAFQRAPVDLLRPEPVEPQADGTAAPRGLLEYRPDPFVSFPDGSMARSSEAAEAEMFRRRVGEPLSFEPAPTVEAEQLLQQRDQLRQQAQVSEAQNAQMQVQDERVAALETAKAQEAEESKQLELRAFEATGVTGKAAVSQFHDLEVLRDRGALTDFDFESAVSLISERKTPAVKKIIAEAEARSAAAEVAPDRASQLTTFVDTLRGFSPEDSTLLQRWLGVDESLDPTNTGAESLEVIARDLGNSKTGKPGVSKVAVDKRLRGLLTKLGLPPGTTPDVVRARFEQSDAVEVPATTPAQDEAGPMMSEDMVLPEEGAAEVEAAEPEVAGDDTVVDDVLQMRARLAEALGVKTQLEAELINDLDSNRVIPMDLEEAAGTWEDMRDDTVPAWETFDAQHQAQIVRSYAAGQLSADRQEKIARSQGEARAVQQQAEARRAEKRSQRQAVLGAIRADGRGTAVAGLAPVQQGVHAQDRGEPAQVAGRGGAERGPGRQGKLASDPAPNAPQRKFSRTATVDEVLSDPGGALAAEYLGALNVQHAMDWVSDWHFASEAAYWAAGTRQHVSFVPVSEGVSAGTALYQVLHEVGHAVDMAHLGNNGVYSTHADMAFGMMDGRITPAGDVAVELDFVRQQADSSEAGTTVARVLRYPLDPTFEFTKEQVDGVDRASQELFGQLWALYAHPLTRAYLEANAPATASFMQKVVSDVQATRPRQAHTHGTALRRADAFSAAYPKSYPDLFGGSVRLARSLEVKGADKAPLRTSSDAGLDSVALSDLQLPGKVKGVKGFIEGIFKDGPWRTHPSLLGWLSAEQLADRFKNLPGVRQFSELTARMSGRANQIMHVSDVIKRRWDALGEPQSKALGDLLLDSTQANMWPNKDFRDDANVHVEDTPENRAAHAKLQERFRTAGKPVQDLYVDVVADFAARRDAKIAGVRKGIVSTYYPDTNNDGKGLTREEVDKVSEARGKAREDLVQTLGTTVRRQRELKSIISDLNQHADTFRTSPGPYFPLMRFGNNVVSVKSKEYVRVENELISAQQALAKAEDTPADTDLKAERDEVKRATTALNALKRDGDAYRVEFFETYGEARLFREQAEAKLGAGYEVNQSIKDQYLKSVDATSPTFMKRIESKLGQYFQGEKGEPIKQAVREMYIQMLPENSMLKSQLKRQNVAGASRDALRSYAASAVRDAHGISRLEYQAPLREALDTLRFDRKEIDAKIVGQELAARLQQNFEYKDHPLLGYMGNMTYLTRLGLSPSFLVTQLTQPWFISAPILAARHHMKAFGALREATAVAGSMLHKDAKTQGTAHFSLDPDRALKAGQVTQDEAVMLQDMLDRGRIDITITQDMGASARGLDDNWLTKATRLSSLPAQQLEVLNRVATALAAYRLQKQLELSRGVDNPTALENAAKYADQIVGETHLNYASENRARHMHPNTWGGWGRIMWQFRSYQQGMLYLVIKNLIDWNRGDKEARRASLWLGGMMLGAAGTTGLPGAAVAATAVKMLYDSLKDEDDERDAMQVMYAGLEAAVGTTMANAIVKGLPAAAGVDISGRVGMGNIASVAPYADDRAEGRDMVAAYWLAAGGAAVGVAADWAEAMKLADEGKYAQAAQRALPKVLSDQIRWARESSEGRTDTRGRVLVAPEDRGVGDALTRAMGFSTTEDARMGERRAAFFDAREKRDSVRQGLLTKFAQARMAGKSVTDIMDDIAAFNGRHPDAKITPANRESAVRNTRDRAKEMRGGVPVRKRDQELAEDLGI